MTIKTVLRGVLAGLVFSVASWAQSTAPAQNGGAASQSQPTQPAQGNSVQASDRLRIAAGSVIPAQLTKTVDAKKAKAGDPVEAKVTEDLKATNGQLVVPKDTKILGHITEAQAHTKEQKESQLAIAFDHAVMKSGADVTLPMSIQAIIAAPSSSPDNSNAQSEGQPVEMPSPGEVSQANANGRPMGGSTPAQETVPSSAGSDAPNKTGANARPQITANTQGVVGISNLSLSTAPAAGQGSLVSSEKSNVKLESGTLLLLRVNR